MLILTVSFAGVEISKLRGGNYDELNALSIELRAAGFDTVLTRRV